MQVVRKYIPANLRRLVKITLRRSNDFFNGSHKKMATAQGNANNFHCIKSIEQPIKVTETAIFKTHNIGLTIQKINHIIIGPGQIFSFWKLVGNPSQKNGYKKSRSIVGNVLQEEVGGGLCQLSGLIYFLALHAGLTITERHSHSLDIYKEEERFTPLGSDATVVYGYKDLRFINPYPFPVCISFQLTANILTGKISSGEKVDPCIIEFEYNRTESHTDVGTISIMNQQRSVINRSRYQLMHQVL